MKPGRIPMALAVFAFATLLLSIALASTPTPRAAGSPAPVVLVEIAGGIGPATREHVGNAIDHAAGQGAPALVLRLDTPGGLDAATRDINAAILASPVPVIGWVGPEGARAASAGTYILYATHLAGMAPATSMGAATPVAMGGSPMPRGEEPGAGGRDGGPPADGQRPGRDRSADGDGAAKTPAGDKERPGAPADPGSRKAINDSVAYLRSLAELRGRDAAFAEAAVREAATLTASQAHAQGVVELLAADVDSLLQQADGRRVALRTGEVTLATAGRTVETFEPDWRSRLLSVITDPTVAYLLLLVGIYGLAFEGYSPGAIVPGVVGAISLLLALYALQVLPVNYAGVALIALGVLLMIAEMFVPSVGVLGLGGVVALVVGSLMLFDGGVPGFRIPVAVIAGVGLASALAFLGTVWLAARARRRPIVTGAEELIGHPGIALADFDGRGRVRVHGEVWQAQSNRAVHRGESVVILGLDGLVLRVTPERAIDVAEERPPPRTGALP